MRQVKTHSYTSPGACALLVTPDEAERLYRLPLWAFRLFTSLILCADFQTGHGQSGYPELIALLTPDQPERGARHWVPSRDDIKHMLRRFVECGLMARDKALSEARGNIIFHIQPRVWESVSGEIAARKLARGASPANPHEQRAKRRPARVARPDTRPHLQEIEHISPLPPNVDNLPTGQAGANGPAEGEKLTPQGGLNVAPAGHAPPPEALTGNRAGREVGSHQGPPGGRKSAPAGHAPQAVLWDDPSTWTRDDDGNLVPPDNVSESLRRRAGYRPVRMS